MVIRIKVTNILFVSLYYYCYSIFLTAKPLTAQTVIEKIVQEETNNSQLQKLAHELLDGIGPRLVGTPQMKKANDWAVEKYASWGINARNEQWGEWKGWERGITHIDMLSPRVKSLEGTQLSWSPSTKGKAVKAEIVIIPDVADSLAFVKTLVKRLQEEGMLSWQLEQVDSSQLKEALIKLQKRRELAVDGKFGVQVVSFLNNTDAEKFKRIAINLDRYKVLPPKMPERYIWVNLPAYKLELWDDDTMRLESKVVVGKPNTRTPLLTSRISDMVTYPQWTIPNSIIMKEIVPALRRNPGYLAKKGYSLLTWEGEDVDPYSVDWTKYKKGIPYKVVQGSGDDNALGILKFNFPNKYSVYLHDTNQRYLFKNAKRALSHGCVRVQEWEKLTYYISALDSSNYESDPKRVVSDSIKVWLERKEKHIVRVKTRLPVYFRYFTAAGKNGKLFFFDDIYHEDKMAREAYFSTK